MLTIMETVPFFYKSVEQACKNIGFKKTHNGFSKATAVGRVHVTLNAKTSKCKIEGAYPKLSKTTISIHHDIIGDKSYTDHYTKRHDGTPKKWLNIILNELYNKRTGVGA